MPVLNKISLRHSNAPENTWTEIASGIRILVKLQKSIREFTSDVQTFSEVAEHADILHRRLGNNLNRYNTPPVYFCEIDNGFISPRLFRHPRHWLIGNDKHFVDDFLNSTWMNSVPAGISVKPAGDDDSIDVKLGQAIHFNQPVLFLNMFSNTNHLLHESLPALLYLKEIMHEHPEYVVYSSHVKPFIKRFLYDIGFPVQRMFEGYETTITAPKILVSCFAGGGHLNNPTSTLEDTCSMISELLPRMYMPGDTPERIFVSRSDATQRRLLNEQEISEYLVKSHNFKVIIPGHMSIAQQVEYFARASIVIGPHGMGINNFAFARSPKLLIELFQPNWVREAYLRQAQIKGASYAAYIGKLIDGNLSVDRAQFADFFEKCLSELPS
uniref:Glycosyltransferase 61 catalytic domain-containing protein n=1 Tax=Pakpunavirus sp. TaxID=2833053 RepID=A0AB39BYS5_9CAUD